ncbi:MAG: methyl-accepting chemotaxis protein [Marinomonas sp.]
MTINRLISIVIIVVLISLVTLFSITEKGLERNENVMREQALISESVGKIKDARYYVVQVQQFLTDIGATRSDEALAEADESKAGAIESFDALEQMWPERAQEIQALKNQLDIMHAAGVKMAYTYIEDGTEAGNALMKGAGGFDDKSAQLADSLDAIASELVTALVEGDQEVIAVNESTHSLALMSSLICGVVIVGSILFLRRRILPALHELDQSLSNIADGAKDLTLRLSEEGKDELSDISRSFNRFIAGIHNLIIETNDKAIQLSSEGKQMTYASIETSKGMEQLQSQTDNITQAISEMQSTVKDVANHAESAALAAKQSDDDAKQSDDDAKQVEQVVNESKMSINSLAKGVSEASDALVSLEQNTENVGSILDVIRGIAEQTNLLALNAAIEAARAGEQGRGFAVVADEVRTLAGRTQESTEQIQNMITELQKGSNAAVSVMAQSREQADASVAHAEQASEALSRIAGSISNISNMATQIASSMDQQAEVSDDITSSISNISDAAQSTSSNAEQSHLASKQVLGHAQALTETMGDFKV